MHLLSGVVQSQRQPAAQRHRVLVTIKSVVEHYDEGIFDDCYGDEIDEAAAGVHYDATAQDCETVGRSFEGRSSWVAVERANNAARELCKNCVDKIMTDRRYGLDHNTRGFRKWTPGRGLVGPAEGFVGRCPAITGDPGVQDCELVNDAQHCVVDEGSGTARYALKVVWFCDSRHGCDSFNQVRSTIVCQTTVPPGRI